MQTNPPLYFIGVDGGGTRCRARLQNRAGQTLGEGMGGASNIRLGMGTVWRNIMVAVDQALAQSGLSHADLSDIHIGLGLAGVTSATSAQVTMDSGPEFGFMSVSSDAHAACLGAFSGRDGGILITGTGSAGYLVLDGVGLSLGGWGFEVGDDGSAAGLGRAALRAALRSLDAIAPASEMTRSVISDLGGKAADAIAFVTTATPSDYGALAPMIIAHALNGDVVAMRLVQDVADEIGRYVARLRDLGAERISLVGGMADPIESWLNPALRALLTRPQMDAVDGALLLARRDSRVREER